MQHASAVLNMFKCVCVQYVPVMWTEQETMNILFLGLNILMWISLYCACTMDPGYIPTNMPEYDLCLKQVCMALVTLLCLMISVHIYVMVCGRVYLCMYVYACLYVYVCAYNIQGCLCVYVCMCNFVYVCMNLSMGYCHVWGIYVCFRAFVSFYIVVCM